MSFEIDVDAAVEEATSRETFDVLEFVKAANLPKKDVTIYTDGDAALKLAHIFVAEAERTKKLAAESLSIGDEDDYDAPDEDEINELHERLTNSALVFHLQGLAPAATRALELHIKATNNDETFDEAFNNSLIAKTIQSVESATGKISTAAWTADKVAALNNSLYVSEATKLFNGAAEVNFIGAIFDRAVNADFS